jgi:hypothetical protein
MNKTRNNYPVGISYPTLTGILKAKIYGLALDKNFLTLDTCERVKYTDKMIEDAIDLAVKWSAEDKAA